MYQVSLEGYINRHHVQLNLYDARDYSSAMREVRTRKHLPHNPEEEWIAILFSDRAKALRDGIPDDMIQTLRKGSKPLYRYVAKLLY